MREYSRRAELEILGTYWILCFLLLEVLVWEKGLFYSGSRDYSVKNVQIFCLVCEQTKS